MNTQTIDLGDAILSDKSQLFSDRRDLRGARRPSKPDYAWFRNAMAASWMLLGLSILTAVLIVFGAEGQPRGIPDLWVHGLFALVLGQFAVAIGASIKVGTLNADGKPRDGDRPNGRATIAKVEPNSALANPPKLPPMLTLAPAPPLRVEKAKGKIGDRIFVEYSDGSVEVDTLLGRRLFPSLDMAQEFIGGVATRASAEATVNTMLAA